MIRGADAWHFCLLGTTSDRRLPSTNDGAGGTFSARRLGVRPLFQPPPEPLFRRRQGRARPGRRLRPAQGLEPGGGGEVAGADPQLRPAAAQPRSGGVRGTAGTGRAASADAAQPGVSQLEF
jgi:hypothetical protein